MYFAHVNTSTYMSIFTQHVNIHLGLTKCKSIFTFTHHVFENFSSRECKVNLLTVCMFLLTEL